MEININCDLGEKSKLHSNENDPALLEIVNSANVACGYHAGDEETMREVIKISKKLISSSLARRFNGLWVRSTQSFRNSKSRIIQLCRYPCWH